MLDARFMAKVRINNGLEGCWLWIGAKNRAGYGHLIRAGRTVSAHRYVWEYINGPLSDSTVFVCHRCDVPSCVNPAHLFLGTRNDNMADMVAKGRWGKPRNIKRGESHHMVKVPDNVVAQIRDHYQAGVTVAMLSTMFHLSKKTLWQYVAGKRRVIHRGV